MKRTKESILAGLLTADEKESVLKSVCSELEIPYKPFVFESNLKRTNQFNNLQTMQNIYIVNLEEESAANLAIVITESNITQQSKIKNVIFFDEKTEKYLVLINSSLKYSIYDEMTDVTIDKTTSVDYKLTADLSISFDTFDDAYNFILSHIFDDAYMDAKLDLAYKVIEPDESENDFNGFEEE